MIPLFYSVSFKVVLFLLAILPPGLAGPACARRNWKADDCVAKCGSRWGWPGRLMGSDAWGPVVVPTTDDLGSVLSQACGTATPDQVSSAAPGPVPYAVTTVSSESSTQISPSVVPPNATSITSTTSTASTTTSSMHATSITKVNHAVVQTPSLFERSTTITSPSSTTTSLPLIEAASTTTTSKSTPTATLPSASSTSSGSSDSGSSTSSSDINAYLLAHNSVRAQHGAAALTWSNDAASKAQEWANQCKFVHSQGVLGPFGENLAAGTGDYAIPTAVKDWTDEVSQYDPSNPQASHFTQVVWKATTQVGCAVATCSGIFDASFGPAQFYVCEYSPPGNVEGEFSQNVQV